MNVAAISLIKGRWIVACDANMTPELLSSSGWLEMVDGVISHSGQMTSSANNIDFFVKDRATADCVHGVQLIRDAETYPHTAVRLLLRANEPRRLRRCLAKPPHIPSIIPDGPHTQPLHEVLTGDREKLTEAERETLIDTPATWDRRPKKRAAARASNASTTSDASEVQRLAHHWTSTSRNIFSAMLGRDVGTSDQAKFVWKPVDNST